MIAKNLSRTSTFLAVLLAAAAVFLAAIVLFVFSGPWSRMEPVHQFHGDETKLKFEKVKALVLRDKESRAPFSFFDAAEVALLPDAIVMRLRFPYSLFRKPLRIAKASMRTCDVSRWRTGAQTNLWLAEDRAIVSVSDPSRQVLRWCESR
jgi:hypothetical protein